MMGVFEYLDLDLYYLPLLLLKLLPKVDYQTSTPGTCTCTMYLPLLRDTFTRVRSAQFSGSGS